MFLAFICFCSVTYLKQFKMKSLITIVFLISVVNAASPPSERTYDRTFAYNPSERNYAHKPSERAFEPSARVHYPSERQDPSERYYPSERQDPSERYYPSERQYYGNYYSRPYGYSRTHGYSSYRPYSYRRFGYRGYW